MKKKWNKRISMLMVFALIVSMFQVQSVSAGELKDTEMVEAQDKESVENQQTEEEQQTENQQIEIEQREEEPAQNQQIETEQSEEEPEKQQPEEEQSENQQSEEQQPEDGETPSDEQDEDVPSVTSEEEEDPFLAEREDKANSWRYIDGEWIQEEHNSRIRTFAQFSTWPNVAGAVAKGIDVSEHNGAIDWTRAKKAGVDYAIIRCGYGMNQANQDDRQWLNNVRGCERNGIPFGVYIYSYADSIERARSEAQHVLRLVSGHKLSYPIYYDLEEYAVRDKLSTSEIAAIAQTFCDIISNAGYDVGIYSNTDWFNNYLTDMRFNQWRKWVAQYYSSCTYKGEYQMWQCSSEGQVDGINGNVDLNISYSRFNTENMANITEGTYTISSGIDNSKLLSVRNASRDENEKIIVWNNSKILSTQRFEIIGIGSGFYKIVVEGTGKVLDISGGSPEAGAEIRQKSWNGADSQKWYFVDAGNGYYYIKSKLGTYLNLKDANAVDGNLVQTYSWSNSSAQKWKLSVSDYHPLADGVYTISAGLNQKKVLDVNSAYTTDGANVQVYNTNQTPAQQFSLTYVGKGYYKIVAKHSSKALDVANGSRYAGANVQQYSWNATDSQLWKLVDAGNGYYYIKSKLGTVLTPAASTLVNGTNVQTNNMNFSDQQKWKLVKGNSGGGNTDKKEIAVKKGIYTIQTSLATDKVLDVSGGSLNNSANVQIYAANNTAAQRMKIESAGNGYYRILVERSGKALDISCANSSSGANVQQYEWNGTAAQLWKFLDAGNGKYYIKSKLGTVLDVSSGNSASGTNVQMYAMNETAAQKWVLKEVNQNTENRPVSDGIYTIKSRLNTEKVLDIAGASKNSGANAQLYSSNGTDAQKYKVTYMGNGFYKIISVCSGKALDVSGGDSRNGANVQQYEWNGTNAQLWKFENAGDGYYYICSSLGKVLDVTYGSTANGTNIQMYAKNSTNSQKWRLTSVK